MTECTAEAGEPNFKASLGNIARCFLMTKPRAGVQLK
jgi:hypothetical protein